MQDHNLPGRQIEIKTGDGRKLYYSIDADQRVYWLRTRIVSRGGKQDVHIQRYRVSDPLLLRQIEELIANG